MIKLPTYLMSGTISWGGGRFSSNSGSISGAWTMSWNWSGCSAWSHSISWSTSKGGT